MNELNLTTPCESGKGDCSHFMDEEREAQRSEVTWPTSHRKPMAENRTEPAFPKETPTCRSKAGTAEISAHVWMI